MTDYEFILILVGEVGFIAVVLYILDCVRNL